MSDYKNNSEVDFERINILYANAYVGYLGMATAIVLLYFVVKEHASTAIASIWAMAVFVAYLPRLALSIIFKRKIKDYEITQSNIKPWEGYFIINSIPPFVCFAAVIYIPYQVNTTVSILFSAIIIFLTAGGILTYGTSKGAIMLFIFISGLSLISKLLLVQNTIYTMLGCCLIFGYILLIRMIIRQNSILLENITLKIENKNHSLMDPLTKLGNRRRLYLYIDKLIPTSRRSDEPFSIIIADIDNFKQYNDTHGHNAGDDLLVAVAKRILESTRDQDLVVRYGGEEFMVVLPLTNIEQAKILAKRMCATVKADTAVTISAGLAVYSINMDFAQLVHEADEALYGAKDAGRDNFKVAV